MSSADLTNYKKNQGLTFTLEDILRIKADAWDEGHHVGMQGCVFNMVTGRMNDEPNPYRSGDE
jgi:hypothetical protein